jgi:hypothetical protein
MSCGGSMRPSPSPPSPWTCSRNSQRPASPTKESSPASGLYAVATTATTATGVATGAALGHTLTATLSATKAVGLYSSATLGKRVAEVALAAAFGATRSADHDALGPRQTWRPRRCSPPSSVPQQSPLTANAVRPLGPRPRHTAVGKLAPGARENEPCVPARHLPGCTQASEQRPVTSNKALFARDGRKTDDTGPGLYPERS